MQRETLVVVVELAEERERLPRAGPAPLRPLAEAPRERRRAGERRGVQRGESPSVACDQRARRRGAPSSRRPRTSQYQRCATASRTSSSTSPVVAGPARARRGGSPARRRAARTPRPPPSAAREDVASQARSATLDEVQRVARGGTRPARPPPQPLERVLANRLEQAEARLVRRAAPADEAAVDERLEAEARVAAPSTASASSSVQPPAKTDERARAARARARRGARSSSRGSRAASAGASGRSRAPSTSSVERPSEPLLDRGRREDACVRAAASSIASGSPSSRRHTAATLSTFASVSANSASTACARAAKRRTASFADELLEAVPVAPGTGSGGTGYSCSPESAQRRAARREHAHARRRGEQRAHRLRRGAELLEVVEHEEQRAVAERSSSGVVSRRRQLERAARPSAARASGSVDRSRGRRRPRRRGARARAPRRRRARAASCPCRRGPVSVTSRTSSRRSIASTAAISSRRPTSDVAGAGRRSLPRRRLARRRARSSSWRRIARSSSCSAGPGSTPSSSTSTRRGRAVRLERLLLAARRGRARGSAARAAARGTGARATSDSSSGQERVVARRARAGRRSGARRARSRSSSRRGAARPRDRLVGEVGERRAAPERERRRRDPRPRRRRGPPRAPCSAPCDEPLEAGQVELVRLEADPVAVAVRLDPVGADARGAGRARRPGASERAELGRLVPQTRRRDGRAGTTAPPCRSSSARRARCFGPPSGRRAPVRRPPAPAREPGIRLLRPLSSRPQADLKRLRGSSPATRTNPKRRRR